MSDPRTTPSSSPLTPADRAKAVVSDRGSGTVPSDNVTSTGSLGVDELLARLKAGDDRRANTMSRLESMLDQWSETDLKSTMRRVPQASGQVSDAARPVVDASGPRADLSSAPGESSRPDADTPRVHAEPSFQSAGTARPSADPVTARAQVSHAHAGISRPTASVPPRAEQVLPPAASVRPSPEVQPQRTDAPRPTQTSRPSDEILRARVGASRPGDDVLGPGAGDVQLVRPAESTGAPLMAFESEQAPRSQTSMFLRAHGLRRLERQPGEVVPWPPESGRDRDGARRPSSTTVAPEPPRHDAAHTVTGRLDALELALVVVKGELDRASQRHALQERRSLVSAGLVFLCAVLAAVLMLQSQRRAAAIEAHVATAQQQAADATRQASELAAEVKRVTGTGAYIPR